MQHDTECLRLHVAVIYGVCCSDLKSVLQCSDLRSMLQ